MKIWILLIVLTVILPAHAQKVQDTIPAMDEAENERERRENLSHEVISPDVLTLYDRLAVMPRWEQKRALGRLPATTKSMLWRHNLRVFLRRHAELSHAQRTIVLEGISFGVAMVFNESCIDQCDADREVIVQGHEKRWKACSLPT